MEDHYDLIIEGGSILTMDPKSPLIKNGIIGIKGSRIARIVARPLKEAAPELDGNVTLRAEGKVIMPDIVNAHTHLFQTLLRGCFNDLPLTPWLKKIYAVGNYLALDEYVLGVRLGCLESIRSGVTTVVEHAFLHPTPSYRTPRFRSLKRWR